MFFLFINPYLVMEVGRGRRQHTPVRSEHLTLDVDGQIAQSPLLSLAVQVVQHLGSDAGETHLDYRCTAAQCLIHSSCKGTHTHKHTLSKQSVLMSIRIAMPREERLQQDDLAS